MPGQVEPWEELEYIALFAAFPLAPSPRSNRKRHRGPADGRAQLLLRAPGRLPAMPFSRVWIASKRANIGVRRRATPSGHLPIPFVAQAARRFGRQRP